jgi:hypothetical protein
MSHQLTSAHGVMEGKGAYNKHALIPADGSALALPVLAKAVRNMTLDRGNQPIVIADYGSSQGKNSLAPMQLGIKAVRSQLGPDRPIFVFHVDLPANDFNTLFEVLDSHPDRYALEDANVFPCAIGRSFYEQVLPSSCVDLGWCSYAAVWLSRVPAPIPGHFIAFRGSDAVRAEFAHQAAQDWKSFLMLRGTELRPGGRLVVVLPARDDDGLSGFEDLMDHANEVLREMVDEGAIEAEERARMVLAAYPRRKCDLLAPFHPDGQFENLSVEHCDLSTLADAAWSDYQRHGNRDVLASKHALLFRSIFIPSLALGLTRAHDAERRRIFADGFESGLKRRLTDQPAPVDSFVHTIVLAKGGSTSKQAVQNQK